MQDMILIMCLAVACWMWWGVLARSRCSRLILWAISLADRWCAPLVFYWLIFIVWKQAKVKLLVNIIFGMCEVFKKFWFWFFFLIIIFKSLKDAAMNEGAAYLGSFVYNVKRKTKNIDLLLKNNSFEFFEFYFLKNFRDVIHYMAINVGKICWILERISMKCTKRKMANTWLLAPLNLNFTLISKKFVVETEMCCEHMIHLLSLLI